MKVGDVIVCGSRAELMEYYLALVREGYAVKVEFDALRVTIKEVPEDDK